MDSTDGVNEIQLVPLLPSSKSVHETQENLTGDGTTTAQDHHRTDITSCARKLEGVCSIHKEAAIYLTEGVENEELDNHPSSVISYYAYVILHSTVYRIIEFVVLILLMSLAFLEKPSFQEAPVQVSPAIEIMFLILLTIGVVLKASWLKFKYFRNHKRTVLKCFIIVLMFVEATVVLVRNESHIRVLRALRIVLLLDSVYLTGVRRIVRQIFQSFQPIFEVLYLLFFFITLFSATGYYLFASDSPTNYQFSSLRESFVSLYIASTTSNFPDVMMESYNKKPFTPIFFIVFLIITLYIISNVLLATVYSAFKKIQKEKFKSLFLHRRNAAIHAFEVLTLKTNGELSQDDYLKLMKYYSPFTSTLHCICTYKLMTKKGLLEKEKFYSFFNVQRFSWRREHIAEDDEEGCWCYNPCFSRMRKCIKCIITDNYFKFIMDLIMLANMIFFLVVTSFIDDPSDEGRFHGHYHEILHKVDIAFIIIFFLEIVAKLIVLGPVKYVRSYWNCFDFIVIFASAVLQGCEITSAKLIFIIPLRFLRLIRFNKRLRAIFNTLVILMPRIISIVVLLLLMYYFYAIIGMEFFAHKVNPGCCGNFHNGTANIQNYYIGNGSNVYYLNNFNNILRSYVTLFELMIINNWWIIMEGFQAGTGEMSSRAFFIAFHLSTYIVVTVVMAFIVEAFDFKIEEVNKEHECVNQGTDKEHKQINQAANEKHENNCREAIDQHQKNTQGGNKEHEQHEHNIQEANEEHEGLLEENEGGNDDENRFVENYTVEISHGEIDNRNMNCFCYHMLICLWKLLGFNNKQTKMKFEGTKRRTRGEINEQLYEHDLQIWINEEEGKKHYEQVEGRRHTKEEEQRLVKRGHRLGEEGDRHVKEGKVLIEEGRRLIEEGRRLVKESQKGNSIKRKIASIIDYLVD
ncbi:two pore calcium channel protein 1-like isoform X2 [Dysidea avara]|uniref:two pore calcium channel protein 1-like isoform X2 n=1 Tax=Dysidea avara TaxID=196820 RepID=UPI00331A8271